MKFKKVSLKESKPFRDVLGSSYTASGKRFKIIYCKELISTDGHRAHGLTCAKTSTIYIDISDAEAVLGTWAHECLHAESFARELFTQSWHDNDIEEHYANGCGRIVEFLMQKAVAQSGKRRKR